MRSQGYGWAIVCWIAFPPLLQRRREDGSRTPELDKRSRARITGDARCLCAQIGDVFKGLTPRCLFEEADWAGSKPFLDKIRQ